MTHLLSGHLLSAQGDRMAMAHGVETRFPFLDPNVMSFGTSLPERLLLHGLREKVLLRRLGRTLAPASAWKRPKQPYRAPGAEVFLRHGRASYVDDLLAPSQIRRDGLFNPEAVTRLVRKFREGKAIGVKDDMALVGVLSTQLVIHHFINHFGTDTHGTPYTGVAAIHHR